MSRYVDIETIKPRQYENSEVELGVLAYDYDEVDAMPFIDIVRCGECKYCVNGQCWKSDGLDKLDGNVADDDFCSRGEREGE